MTIGIKYLSYPDHSGYGLAALAYLRALHNAGVPVWWEPVIHRDGRQRPWRPDDGMTALALAIEAQNDAALEDVPALLQALRRKPYDTVVVHTVPEHWPELVEAGKRNVGYTVWETDALPSHWRALLDRPERVLVPNVMTREVFVRSGVRPPVTAVPHIRRHAWNVASAGERAALRRDLGIPDDHFVFYTIGTWDPRKALADLITTFCDVFSGDDKVSLVVKTSTEAHPQTLEPPAGGIVAHSRTLVERAARASGRAPAHVIVRAADGVAGRAIDALHAMGDCFVSLTHGEGWGMGAFEAAALGKPVLITGFGGPSEFLGDDYPGLIGYAMVPVAGWTRNASFQAPQRWALADPQDARRKLRRVVVRYGDYLEAAARVAERIVNRYSEPVVARQLIAALDA